MFVNFSLILDTLLNLPDFYIFFYPKKWFPGRAGSVVKKEYRYRGSGNLKKYLTAVRYYRGSFRGYRGSGSCSRVVLGYIVNKI